MDMVSINNPTDIPSNSQSTICPTQNASVNAIISLLTNNPIDIDQSQK